MAVAARFMVPSDLYGRTADVRRVVARVVTAVRKGRSIHEALNGDVAPVDAEHPGLLVIDRMWSSIGTNEPHFHLDLLWRRLKEACYKADDRASFDRASREALEQPWSFIGLLGGQIYEAVTTAAAQLRTLEAAAVHWPALCDVGVRYTRGSNIGEPIAKTNTLVAFCLARQGAPMGELGDLTPARLHKHTANLPGFRVRGLLEAGDITRALAALHGHDGLTLLSLAEHFLQFGLDDLACDAVGRLSTPGPYESQRGCMARRPRQPVPPRLTVEVGTARSIVPRGSATLPPRDVPDDTLPPRAAHTETRRSC